ncbi:MAG TPA: hypothetical protein VNX47_12005, partial [Nevskia sp.]|nr:hypothetical protein [Nevskia sp.]
MSGQPPGKEDEDFRDAMAGVAARAASDRLPPVRRRPSTRPRQTEDDERAVLAELLTGPYEPEAIEAADLLAYRAPGLQDSVWRRLKRGSFRVGAELDLHGLNRGAAQYAVV